MLGESKLVTCVLGCGSLSLLSASVPTTIGGLAAGLAYFGNTETDPTQLIMGIEPIWM